MTTDGRRRTTRTVWAQSPSTRPESATILSALSAATFAFDSAGDGITSQDGQHIAFASSTTGDIDGIDLTLDRADGGRLIFESAVGCCGLLWAVVRWHWRNCVSDKVTETGSASSILAGWKCRPLSSATQKR